MHVISIPTDAALANVRQETTPGQRLTVLRLDAPISIRLTADGSALPIDRPGRILHCAAAISEVYVTLAAADVVAGGFVVLVVSDAVDFDFPGGAPLRPAQWTERASQDNALATAAKAAVAGRRHVILYAWASFSDPGVSKLLTIKRGAVTASEHYIHGSDIVPLELPGAAGEAVSAELAASGSGGVIGKVVIIGYTT